MQNFAYLVDGIRLIIVNNTQLAGFQIKHLDLLDIDHVANGQADLDAVTFVSTTKYDPLKTVHPILGTVRCVCSKIVGAVICLEGEMQALFVVVGKGGGDTIAKVDMAVWKVLVGRALII